MFVARIPALALLCTLAALSATPVFAEKVLGTQPPEKAAALRPAGYEPGEKWRTTMSMSMMGMNMPGMTNDVCVPKGGDQAPVAVDKNCQILDRQRAGNRETFRMVCTGKDAMEGTMEMVYEGRDHYSGKMLARTSDGEMTMNYEGRKLPGECDAGEMKRKMAALVAQSNAQTAKVCKDGARDGQASLFVGPDAICRDPKDKQVFCGTAQGYRGFAALSNQERMGSRMKQQMSAEIKVLSGAARTCGFGVDAKREQLCSGAEGKGEWAFLAVECPKLGKPLAQRECAGRNFTTPVAPKYQKFCEAYASGQSGAAGSGGESDSNDEAGAAGKTGDAGASGEPGATGTVDAEDPQQKKSAGGRAKDSLKKGTEKLKGLFGR